MRKRRLPSLFLTEARRSFDFSLIRGRNGKPLLRRLAGRLLLPGGRQQHIHRGDDAALWLDCPGGGHHRRCWLDQPPGRNPGEHPRKLRDDRVLRGAGRLAGLHLRSELRRQPRPSGGGGRVLPRLHSHHRRDDLLHFLGLHWRHHHPRLRADHRSVRGDERHRLHHQARPVGPGDHVLRGTDRGGHRRGSSTGSSAPACCRGSLRWWPCPSSWG